MLYTDFLVGEKTYKLRLNTRNIVLLEKALGMNPVLIFSNAANKHAPTVEQMVLVLHYSLRWENPEITLDEAYDIFDAWLEEGHITGEFVSVITEIYMLSGLFKKEKNEKNA